MNHKADLRERAESLLCDKKDRDYTFEEIRKLVRDLSLHQIELELQNEQLCNAQVALADSHDNYQKLYDFSPAAYLTLDKSGKVIEANLIASQMFGLDYSQLKATHFRALCRIPEGDLSFCPEIPDEHEIVDIQFKREGGADFWGQVTTSYDYCRKEKEERVRLAIIDVTEKKKALQDVVDIAKFPDEDRNPVMRLRKNGDLLYANPPATRLLKDISLQSGRPGNVCILESIAEAVAGWEPCSQAVQCQGRWFSLAINPVIGEDYINIYGQDVTSQRELEKQVHQKLKMEVVGLLAGGIAHDFNNILAAIMGFASLAENEASPESSLHYYISSILDATDRAKELVNKVLLFSRHSHDTKKVMSLTLVLEEVSRFLRASLPSSIDIRCEIKRPPSVYADATRIHEVIMNLCSNAAYAMNERGVLEISCYEKVIQANAPLLKEGLEPGVYAAISIKDNGCGMSSDIVSHAIEPFFTTKESGLGCGMGMAIVNGIIQSHQGYLDIQSEPEIGTTITILLPAAAEEPKQLEKKQDEIPNGTERILFVDDEATITELAEMTLTQLGYNVTGFSDSRQALAAFNGNPYDYDLVITDQTMPGLSGMELAEKVRSTRPDIPIILCTGYSKVVDEKVAVTAGIKGFFIKPLKRGEFARKIRDVLDNV